MALRIVIKDPTSSSSSSSSARTQQKWELPLEVALHSVSDSVSNTEEVSSKYS
jgi:hypothetical protein